MDAVKFLKEKKRMCRAYDLCSECPAAVKLGRACKITLEENYEELVKIVENWSKENPEEVGKKYIIEISEMTATGKFQVKGTHETFTKAELDFFEEYKESEE